PRLAVALPEARHHFSPCGPGLQPAGREPLGPIPRGAEFQRLLPAVGCGGVPGAAERRGRARGVPACAPVAGPARGRPGRARGGVPSRLARRRLGGAQPTRPASPPLPPRTLIGLILGRSTVRPCRSCICACPSAGQVTPPPSRPRTSSVTFCC